MSTIANCYAYILLTPGFSSTASKTAGRIFLDLLCIIFCPNVIVVLWNTVHIAIADMSLAIDYEAKAKIDADLDSIQPQILLSHTLLFLLLVCATS